MTRVPLLAVLLTVAGPPCARAAAAPLEARFIANEAFSITDGRVTLLTDFPYQSGYSGYMTYDLETVRPEGRVLTLITHRHQDHFDPLPFREKTWSILGPKEVTRGLPAARVVALHPRVSFEGITIEPFRTPHRDTEHYSYLVTWNGLRLYFVGDTEDTRALLAQPRLDALFVTPWLWQSARRRGHLPDARLVVIYHHTLDETVADCDDCWIPRQGERRSIAAGEAAAGAAATGGATAGASR